MMFLLAAAAIGMLIATSTLVAVRLLLLNRRTGAWPELLLGSMLLLSVGIGYPLYSAATRVGPEWSGAFFIAGDLVITVGLSLLFLFTWLVFRPQAVWACAFAVGGVGFLLVTGIHRWLKLYGGGVAGVLDLPLHEVLLETVPLAVAYLWTAAESLRYWGMMRRRAKLGLADAVVTNRFLVWGLMALAATGGVVLNTVAVALDVDVFTSPAVLLASSVTGSTQTVCLVLAFLPPQSYLRWVHGRTAAPAD